MRQNKEERLLKVNQVFLSLGPDFDKNIEILVRTCGEILGGTCGLYNKLDKGILCSIGKWNVPSDMDIAGDPEGHICYDVMKKCKKGDFYLVKDLPSTSYFKTDPNVVKYDLKTYIGYPVFCQGKTVGSLCVVFQEDADIDSDDTMFLGILAEAICREEERKHAIETCLQTEMKYKVIAENTSDLIVMTDLDGIYTYVSPSNMQLGYAPEDLLGRSAFDFVHPEDKERVRLAFKKYSKEYAEHVFEANKGKVTEKITYRFTDKSGNWHDIEVTGNLVKMVNGGGHEYGAVFVSHDITERLKAERDLKESRERYRTLFEGASEGILVAEITTKKFLFANPAISRMLGYKEEELKCMRVDDIHPRESVEQILDEFMAQARGEKTLIVNIPCLRKDGTIIYADISAGKILIDGKECNVGLFTDITRRRQAETVIEENRKLLDKTNKELRWKIEELEAALTHIKRLEGLIPICMNCKKMRLEDRDPTDLQAWVPLEKYITTKTDAFLTHGLCPECLKKLYGERKDEKER